MPKWYLITGKHDAELIAHVGVLGFEHYIMKQRNKHVFSFYKYVNPKIMVAMFIGNTIACQTLYTCVKNKQKWQFAAKQRDAFYPMRWRYPGGRRGSRSQWRRVHPPRQSHLVRPRPRHRTAPTRPVHSVQPQKTYKHIATETLLLSRS